MTTAKTPKSQPSFSLPCPPEIPDEKMTAARYLHLPGNGYHLAQHLGDPDTTIVGAELYITPIPTSERADMRGVVYPDLLVAFNVDPAAYSAHNGYVISEQGKPPDFVLEIASASTGRRDTIDKRVAYADLGIPEYWRFDADGRFHGARLAGDRLAGGRYESIPIDELPDGSLRGRSVVLNLDLRWTDGQLVWFDPAIGAPIATLASEREALAQEREARTQERAALAQERAARIQAEARITELEDRLRELRGE